VVVDDTNDDCCFWCCLAWSWEARKESRVGVQWDGMSFRVRVISSWGNKSVGLLLLVNRVLPLPISANRNIRMKRRARSIRMRRLTIFCFVVEIL